MIVSSKWRVTCRAGQAVLGLGHPSVGVDGSWWTWVLVFGPGPGRAVMTYWTLISPRQGAVKSARTIKTIQTKQKWNNLVTGC